MTAVAIKRPDLCGVLGIPFAMRCAIKSLIHMACAVRAVPGFTGAGGRVNAQPQNQQNTCTCKTHMPTAHTAHTAHPFCSNHLRVLPYPTINTTHPTKKKMDGKEAKRVIRCTPENAADMRALVARWPELDLLVRSLQAQNLFPGLRALQITLSGPEEWVAKGVGAVMAENAPQAAIGEGC